MRVLVVHAHPVETSFNRALYDNAVAALKEAGHEVDPLNLYEENFQGVMSREERLAYHDIPENLTPANREAETVYLGLRTTAGLALRDGEAEFVRPWVAEGWGAVDDGVHAAGGRSVARASSPIFIA